MPGRLREKVKQALASGGPFLFRPHRGASKTALARERMPRHHQSGNDPRNPVDQEEILLRAIKKLKEGRELQYSEAKVFAYSMLNHELLRDDKGARRNFLDFMRSRMVTDWGKQRILAALMRSYIDHFEPERQDVLEILQFISDHRELLDSAWKSVLKEAAKLSPSVNLLDDQFAHKKMGRVLLSSDVGELGLVLKPRYLLGSKWLSCAYLESAVMVADEIRRGNLSSAKSFLESVKANTLENMGAAVLIGLLEPFGRASITHELKDAIMDLAMASYGDPRLRIEKWPTVPDAYGGDALRERALNVVKGWLSQASLDIFIDVIQAHADHQFEKRRELWERYIKQGFITEVWVVFGRQPERTVRNLKQSGQYSYLQYGLLKGALANQSVLLMKVNGYTLAEWSHSGKFRLWNPGNKYRPVMYESSYEAIALRLGSDKEQVHLGNWVPRIEAMVNEVI